MNMQLATSMHSQNRSSFSCMHAEGIPWLCAARFDSDPCKFLSWAAGYREGYLDLSLLIKIVLKDLFYPTHLLSKDSLVLTISQLRFAIFFRNQLDEQNDLQIRGR